LSTIIKVFTLLFVFEECSGQLYRASWCYIGPTVECVRCLVVTRNFAVKSTNVGLMI